MTLPRIQGWVYAAKDSRSDQIDSKRGTTICERFHKPVLHQYIIEYVYCNSYSCYSRHPFSQIESFAAKEVKLLETGFEDDLRSFGKGLTVIEQVNHAQHWQLALSAVWFTQPGSSGSLTLPPLTEPSVKWFSELLDAGQPTKATWGGNTTWRKLYHWRQCAGQTFNHIYGYHDAVF